MIIKFLNKVTVGCLIFIIKFYQLTISPLIKSNCRYLPTCSEYAITALKERGLLIGVFYSVIRIFSCHPFGKSGYDPVPKKITKD